MAYDLKQSVIELKTSIIGTNLPPAGPSLIDVLRRIGVALPLETDDKFEQYETKLALDVDDMAALRLFMKILINNHKDVKSCVSTILTKLITKEVSLKYSGYGKEVFGKKKKNFRETNVCRALLDVIIEMLGTEVIEKNIMSHVSTWLSHASDREGGRKARQSGAKRRSRSA